MRISAISALAGLLGLAASQDTRLPVPNGAQIGELDFTITCSALSLVNISLEGLYSGTASFIAETGQETYLTDVAAALTIPDYLIDLAGIIGATEADTLVHIDIDFTNASPSTFAVFPDGLWVNGTDLTKSPVIVHVPMAGVLSPIGPVTLGEANKVSEIFLGVVSAEIYLHNRTGGSVLFPLDISCPKQSPELLLAVIDVVEDDGGQTVASEPSNGFVPDFPALSNSEEYGCFSFNYTCNVGQFDGLPFPVEACAGIEAFAPAGSQFSIQNTTAYITVPGDIVALLPDLYPGATQLTTTVDAFYIAVSEASPAALNGLSSPYTITSQISSNDLTLVLPESGVLTVGPYTAGSSVGDFIFVTLGNATASVNAKDANGNSLGNLAVTCQPPLTDTYLVGITITPAGSGTTTSAGLFPGLPTGFPGFPSSFPGLPTSFTGLPF